MSMPADTAEHTSDTYGGAYAATFTFARNLIAALPTFQQAILGVTSAEDAKLKVYKQETLAESDEDLPAPDEDIEDGDPLPDLPPKTELHARPYCLLRDFERSTRRVGTSTWASQGSLVAAFEVPVPSEYRIDYDQDDAATKKDKHCRFIDWRVSLASTIEDEIRELSGQGDVSGNPYLNVIDLALLTPPADAAEDVPGEPYIGFEFQLRWR